MELSSSARDRSRKMTKKRKEELSYDNDEDEDADAVISTGEASVSVNKKQRREHDDDDGLEEEEEDHQSKKIKKIPRKIQPNKARKLNDALKDFQNTFGISSPSSASASASSAVTPVAKSRSTPSSTRQNGFKSSFGDSHTDNLRQTTPARTGISTTSTTKPLSRQLRPLNAESTPVKTIPSRSVAANVNPPGGHKNLLESNHEHSSSNTLDKGKGRAIESLHPAQSEEDFTASGPHHESNEASTATIPRSNARQHGQVTSLLELSNKKQFKMPSTPSKPSPLSSGRVITRLETPSGGDIKPLKSLGVISGLNALSHNTATPSTDVSQGVLGGEDVARGAATKQDIKPKWAQLLETTESNNHIRDINQDISELLSPRKKRKGWVPSGNAEIASGIIKRLQTASNLWIHEISRTLSNLSTTTTSSSSSSSSKTSVNQGLVEKEYPQSEHGTSSSTGSKKDYRMLLNNLNPHLRLEILEVLSPKPASLTWSTQEAGIGQGGGGGFITAGAAEKLLITRCKILADEDSMNNNEEDSQATQESSLGSNTIPLQLDNQSSEGIVIFSLAAHSRTSSGVSLVRKEQQRPSREEKTSTETDADSNTTAKAQNTSKSQPQLDFRSKTSAPPQEDKTKKKWTVFIPASIADLHTQLRSNDEIWIWEPWSVVDLFTPQDARSALFVVGDKDGKVRGDTDDEEGGVEKATEKALLVSRFAVLL